MAVNTRAKRYSLLGLLDLGGGIDQADRQTLLGLYGGILASQAVAAVGVIHLSVSAARQPYLTVSAARQPYTTVSAARRPYITVTEG